MTGKQCKVNTEWFQKYTALKDGTRIQFKDFLTKHSDFELNCLACKCKINVKSKGIAAVSQHIGKEKHETSMEIQFNKNQSKFEVT